MSDVVEFARAQVLTRRAGLTRADEMLPAFAQLCDPLDTDAGLLQVKATTEDGSPLARGNGVYVLSVDRLERCYQPLPQPA